MSRKSSCFAIVPAAGVGVRMGSDIPKQYLSVADRPVLERAVNALTTHPRIERVMVVLHPDDTHWSNCHCDCPEKITTTPGGKERMHSVHQGLIALKGIASSDDWILVHDAARPCLSKAALDRLLETLISDPVGGLLAINVCETVKRVDAKHRIEETIDREPIWLAQTPQMFRYGDLTQAIESAIRDGVCVTDESYAMERMGHHPTVVLGDRHNIKITTPDDIHEADLYCRIQTT